MPSNEVASTAVDDQTRAELDQLLHPDAEEQAVDERVSLLQRVLDGLEAIEVAETPAEREAALASLPESTGADTELDALLARLKQSGLYVQDDGMTVKLAIARARFVRRLVAPTRLRQKLPKLYKYGATTGITPPPDADGEHAAGEPPPG